MEADDDGGLIEMNGKERERLRVVQEVRKRRLRQGQAARQLGLSVRQINLETAVVMAAKQRRSSIGAAFRAIPATAEQFQIGERPPLKLFSLDRDLGRLAAVNCGS